MLVDCNRYRGTFDSIVAIGVFVFVVIFFGYPLEKTPRFVFYSCVLLPTVVHLLLDCGDKLTWLKKTSFSLVQKILLISVLYIWFSSLWSGGLNISLFIYNAKRVVELFSLLYAIHITVQHFFKKMEIVFQLMFATAIVHSLVIIPQINMVSRVTNPIDTGIVFGIVFVIGIWNFLVRKELAVAVTYLLCSTPLFVVILMTKSRGPQSALLVTVLVLFFLHRQHWRRSLMLCVGAVVCGVMVFLAAPHTVELVFSRGIDMSMRDLLWKESFVQFMDNPLFGSGMSRTTTIFLDNGYNYTQSHNFLLDTLRLTGITGFLLVLSQVVLALFWGFRQTNKQILLWAVILLFGVLCLMVSGKIPFTRPSHEWIAYWIPVCFIASCMSNKSLKGNMVAMSG